MRNRVMLAIVLASGPAWADCARDIDGATRRAAALPATAGRAALMEQILRADNARHEGDEAGCLEELSVAQEALRAVER